MHQTLGIPDLDHRPTDDPLDPDDVVSSSLWNKVLQATAEVVTHPFGLLSQVGLGFVQELLSHVYQVHGGEQRQKKTFGDPPNAGATVQGTARACLTLTLLQGQTQDDNRDD